MASGWANDDAVNEQINSTIEDCVAFRAFNAAVTATRYKTSS